MFHGYLLAVNFDPVLIILFEQAVYLHNGRRLNAGFFLRICSKSLRLPSANFIGLINHRATRSRKKCFAKKKRKGNDRCEVGVFESLVGWILFDIRRLLQ